LKANKYYETSISFITKKIVTEYLKDVLKRINARYGNNSRTDITSMYQLLEDYVNFVRRILKLESVPKKK
jgi:hypothetical protein